MAKKRPFVKVRHLIGSVRSPEYVPATEPIQRVDMETCVVRGFGRVSVTRDRTMGMKANAVIDWTNPVTRKRRRVVIPAGIFDAIVHVAAREDVLRDMTEWVKRRRT